jgi:hypothetical protein
VLSWSAGRVVASFLIPVAGAPGGHINMPTRR